MWVPSLPLQCFRDSFEPLKQLCWEQLGVVERAQALQSGGSALDPGFGLSVSGALVQQL